MLSWTFNNPVVEVLALSLVAMLLAGFLGAQRERAKKAAGLRTHMLVALGSAVLILACRQSGMNQSDISRVIQGIAAGVGFIGGGAILKLSDHEEVRGLTTATSIWLTTAVGVTVGMGNVMVAVVTTCLALTVLTLFARVEGWIEGKRQ
jgi:putative Mg2+ transporter-C (MgtC) family protein